jgi:very-short-patch-repair endonuclease
VCGAEFKAIPSNIKKGWGKYCSNKCANIISAQKRNKQEQRQCLSCGKTMTATQHEIKKGHRKFCSKKCADDSRRLQETRKCIICGKEFTRKLSGIKNNGGKYCSFDCYTIGQTTHEIRQCLICGNDFKAPQWKIKKGYSKYCSAKCLSVAQTTRITKKCLVCGNEFTTIPAEIKRGNGKFCSSVCMGVWVQRHMRTKNTNIECMLQDWLIENNIAFTPQYPIPRITIADIFILPNICLFADGDYWHKKPGREEKDKQQTMKLENEGYIVIRLWGSEITNGVRPLEILDMYKRG